MSQLDEAIRDHETRCAEELPKKYVPWTWVVGICVLLLGAIGGTSAALSKQLQKVDTESSLLQENDRRQDLKIEKIEQTLADQNREILTELRAIRTGMK